MADLSVTVGIYSGARKSMEESWRLCRTLRGGTPAMRDAGTEFTPRTAREEKEPTLYRERLLTTVLYNVYEETICRIAALPFTKPPTITGELPPQLQRIVDDADRAGSSLSVFMAQVYQDAVDRGMGLFLVDNVETKGLSVMEAEAIDARPYFSRIEPDNFIGCKTELRNGREVCTELRIREWAYQDNPGGIGQSLVERVRRYTTETVELWERNYSSNQSVDRASLAGRTDSGGYRLIEPPKPHGFPNGDIPIVAVYTNKQGFLYAKPPMMGLAYLNAKHWNQQSIHDNALRYCLSPILFGKGLPTNESNVKPKTGEGATLLSKSDTAELKFVEIAGTSLAASERMIDKTEARMKASASEPLTNTATATGEVRAEVKEQSESQRWTEACEWSIYYAFALAARWIDQELPEDFNVSLYRSSSMLNVSNPQRTVALQADVQNGRLTLETYLKERARSGDFADDFDPTAEAAAVEQEKARNDEMRMAAMIASVERDADGADAQPEDEQEPPDAEAAVA